MHDPGGADERAEFHQGLIGDPRVGAGAWNQRTGCRLQSTPSGGIVLGSRMEHAAEDAVHVRVDRRCVPLEGKRGHRAGGVGADTRQGTEGVDTVGECATLLADDVTCQAVQVGGPAIVSEASPRLPDRSRPRLGQGLEGGEARKEVMPVSFDPGDLRLLEHDLGDEDPVGIARPTPWQVTAVAAEPLQESPLESPPLARCFEAGWGAHERRR